MQVIYLKGQQLNIEQPVCVALGFFDGLHVGHMALVEQVIRIANQKSYRKALMTFDHYPLYVLGKVKEEHYLTSMNDRIHLLEKMDIDYLFVIEFHKEVAALSPQAFIRDYLQNCHVQHVVCGYDFRFGAKNQGTIQMLQECPLFDVTVVNKVIYQGEKISSSCIRQALQQGHIDNISALLGRHYCITGKVIRGRHIGHSLGFPTANIQYGSYFLPKNGVYIVKVHMNEKNYMGMCNIGYNPTFTALEKKSLEVNILDFDGDIYGQKVSVVFYQMLRDEKAFSSKEDLIQQLHHDQQQVRLYFQRESSE